MSSSTSRSDIEGVQLNGLLQWLDMRLTRRRHDRKDEIAVTMEVINIEPGAYRSTTLNGGSTSLSENVLSPATRSRLAHLIKGILEHELDEGIIVESQRRWDPHADDYGPFRRPIYTGTVVRSRDLFSHTGSEVYRPEYRPLLASELLADYHPVKMSRVPEDFPAAGLAGLMRPPLSYVERPHMPRKYDERRRGIRPRTYVDDPALFSFEGTLAVLCPRIYFRSSDDKSALVDPLETSHPVTIEVDLLLPSPNPASNMWQDITLSIGCEDTPGSREFADSVRGCIHGVLSHVLESCIVFAEPAELPTPHAF